MWGAWEPAGVSSRQIRFLLQPLLPNSPYPQSFLVHHARSVWFSKGHPLQAFGSIVMDAAKPAVAIVLLGEAGPNRTPGRISWCQALRVLRRDRTGASWRNSYLSTCPWLKNDPSSGPVRHHASTMRPHCNMVNAVFNHSTGLRKLKESRPLLFDLKHLNSKEKEKRSRSQLIWCRSGGFSQLIKVNAFYVLFSQ